MTAAVAERSPALRTADTGVRSAYLTELHKLIAQLPTRLLAIVCVLGPFAFAAVLKVQSGTPADALFGIWVHSSGFAVSLVILSFAGNWGFPIVAGVVAGDLFSSEDRHGTWKTILTRSCTREDVFAGKLLAAGTVTIGLSLLLAASSIVAGVLLVGAHSLVNLSGALTSPGRVLALTIVAWLICLLPMLAYMSIAILCSLASRNGIIGVLGPLLVALLCQLLALIGKGVIVHLLLVGSGFDGWHGLFTAHPFFGPLVTTSVVSVVWIAVALTASWRLLRRRDFVTGSTAGRDWVSPLRGVAIATAVVAVLALCCSLGPTGVTATRVATAVGAEFGRVTLLQQAIIGRDAPASARLNVQPQCNRRGTRAVGPGDWNCNLYVYLPQPNKAVPFQLTSVDYDVSVQSNGCYKAASPPAFLGAQTIRDAAGRSVTNPLFVVYGCFNVL